MICKCVIIINYAIVIKSFMSATVMRFAEKHLGIMQKTDTCKIVGNMFSNGNVNGTFVEYFYAKELFELQFTTKI